MLVTVGQPLHKARTTTTGPCRAHTVFGRHACRSWQEPCEQAARRSHRPRRSATACRRPQIPGPAGVGHEIDILAMAQIRTLVSAQDPRGQQRLHSVMHRRVPGRTEIREGVPGRSDDEVAEATRADRPPRRGCGCPRR